MFIFILLRLIIFSSSFSIFILLSMILHKCYCGEFDIDDVLSLIKVILMSVFFIGIIILCKKFIV